MWLVTQWSIAQWTQESIFPFCLLLFVSWRDSHICTIFATYAHGCRENFPTLNNPYCSYTHRSAGLICHVKCDNYWFYTLETREVLSTRIINDFMLYKYIIIKNLKIKLQSFSVLKYTELSVQFWRANT